MSRSTRKTIARATDTFAEILVYYAIVITIASALFAYLEEKPFFDSVWWACVTGMTIGYGDMYPVTTGGKIVALILIHIVPLIIVPLIVARLLSHIIEDQHEFSHEEQEIIKEDIRQIKIALQMGSPAKEQRTDEEAKSG